MVDLLIKVFGASTIIFSLAYGVAYIRLILMRKRLVKSGDLPQDVLPIKLEFDIVFGKYKDVEETKLPRIFVIVSFVGLFVSFFLFMILAYSGLNQRLAG